MSSLYSPSTTAGNSNQCNSFVDLDIHCIASTHVHPVEYFNYTFGPNIVEFVVGVVILILIIIIVAIFQWDFSIP